MNILVLRPSGGDGYPVFRAEGDAFARLWRRKGHAVTVTEIDALKVHPRPGAPPMPIGAKAAEYARRRSLALAAIDAQPKIDWLVFLCHGWRTGLQFGFQLGAAGGMADLVRRLALRNTLDVTLYSCSCGSGPLDTRDKASTYEDADGGFADELRDAMCRAGLTQCSVDAHATVGHATKNPLVRRFDGHGSTTGGHGGTWIVKPGSPQWRRWVAAMRNTDLRYRAPLMMLDAIHAELG